MRPEVIVVVLPGFEFPAGMGRAGEDRLVQTFVPEPRIEALDEPVLTGLARRDRVPLDIALL